MAGYLINGLKYTEEGIEYDDVPVNEEERAEFETFANKNLNSLCYHDNCFDRCRRLGTY